MIINHNISAMNAHRMLVENAQDTSKTLEKLSSGIRINRGADDAAGLAVSEKMRAQVRGLHMAYRNAQDGVSLLQTAEGYLQETTSAIQRMRELSVQAANGIYTEADRNYIQSEVNQLVNEVERIATQSQFNTKFLFLGNLGSENEAKGLKETEGSAPTSKVDLDNPATAGMPLHIGPNMDQRIIVTIKNLTSGALGLAESTQPSSESPAVNEVKTTLNLSNPEGANRAIGTLDKALNIVNEERTRLGAYQNRLETAMRGIDVATENLQASESRIRDSDLAKEMIDFVKLNILSQSSASMLAQANLRPQLILRVLG